MLEAVWFALLAWTLATYVVLDGFDLGAGILHPFVARTEDEREQVIDAVGPVWDGNEVWLIAAAGTMLLAFPTLLATAFSGFYLPLMVVLWLLVFRALGIELRHQLNDRMWTAAWDAAFLLASLALAFTFGAALGNVVRGVPLTPDGTFFEPLWTDFRVGAVTGILDWYTLLVGITAVVALAYHGGRFLAAQSAGAVAQRSARVASGLWSPLIVLLVLVTVATFRVQPNAISSLAGRPWGLGFPILGLGGLLASRIWSAQGRPGRAFLASCAFLYGMIATAAVGIYPYVLPARNAALGLTAAEAASASGGLSIALLWWIPGMVLATGYTVYAYRGLFEEVRSKPLH